MQRTFRRPVQLLPRLRIFLLIGLGLSVRHRRLPGKHRRPFQGRPRRICPNALQVGVTVRRPRQFPRRPILGGERGYRKERERTYSYQLPAGHNLASE